MQRNNKENIENNIKNKDMNIKNKDMDTKNKDMDIKNKDMDDKIKIIDIIIEMYPELKKEKNNIINVVLEKLNKPNKYVFTKILYNNEELYVNTDGTLLTKNVDFIGFVINNKFYLVSDIDNKDDILDISEMDRIMYS